MDSKALQCNDWQWLSNDWVSNIWPMCPHILSLCYPVNHSNCWFFLPLYVRVAALSACYQGPEEVSRKDLWTLERSAPSSQPTALNAVARTPGETPWGVPAPIPPLQQGVVGPLKTGHWTWKDLHSWRGKNSHLLATWKKRQEIIQVRFDGTEQ